MKATYKVTVHFQHKDTTGHNQENIAQAAESIPYLLPSNFYFFFFKISDENITILLPLCSVFSRSTQE